MSGKRDYYRYSNHSLSNQLGFDSVVKPNSPEEIAAVKALIPRHSPDRRTAETLAAMILPDTELEAA